MHTRLITLLIVATALSLSGCASDSNMMNVQTMYTASGKASPESVTQAILNACGANGWKPSIAGPGRIIAFRHSGGHAAKVDISYTSESFTIQYLDSDNMGYDGKHISDLYNQWVDELRSAIKSRLMQL